MTNRQRLALVGAGVMGRRYLDAFSSDPNGEIVAICELDEARREALAAAPGAPRLYRDLAQMVGEIEVDGVIVATPDFAHRDACLTALNSGLHVLCEKPLATSVEEALEIAKAARGADRSLMVNFGNRHRPSAQRLKQAIEEGAIGTPHYAFMCLNEKSLKTATLPWAAQTSPLWFLLSHVCDFLYWIFDDRVESVYAAKSTRAAASTTTGILRFANGATATIESSWDMPAGYPRDIDLRINVHGTEGVVDLDIGDQGFILSSGPKTASIHWDAPGGANPADWWNRSCHAFTRRIASGEAASPDADDGLEVVMVLAGLQKSLDTGRAIRLAEEWPDAASYLG